MNVTVFFQVVSVWLLLFFVILEMVGMKGLENSMNSTDRALWTVQARRIGIAENNIRTIIAKLRPQEQQVKLFEGRYLAGNRLTDELYLDVAGRRVKFYLNVYTDRLYLTVLKGEVLIEYFLYKEDVSQRISIPNRTKVTIRDLELEFVKESVG